MKTIKLTLLSVFLIVFLGGCSKIDLPGPTFASLKIVNTVTGGASVRMGALTTAVTSNSNANFALPSGSPDIYVWPITDSTKPYYNSNKSVGIASGEYYSLFLTGTATAAEGILVKESYPIYADSVAGIRFINLCPNSTPLNVTLSTSTTTNQFAGIEYKQLTSFKTFAAGNANSSYTFQVRSAASPNTVIASITLSGNAVTSNVPRFMNITLVFKGTIGGSGVTAPTIVRVNHF